MTIIRHVVFRGRVQGVGFRAFVAHAALARDIQGWVRNRRDGSVEALFCGPERAVAAMTEACRQGPQDSRVDDAVVRAGTADESAQRRLGEIFSMLPTL
jgi:acylphosphatase